jgi:glycosyltransferase involved in cell wall biosynthesis
VLHELERHHGRLAVPARVIANGIDFDAFRPLPKRPVVMAAGRVWDKAKNLALLDRVAADLAWPVVVAGDRDHAEGGAPHFARAHLLGRLSAAEMARRLGAAAIFAAPARYEPFGLAILEAAAAGCALVLGDIASLRETWQDAAVFVPPDDAAAWRAALQRLIADAGERARWAAAARHRARRFSIARTAEAYGALYGALLAAPASQFSMRQ